jgi:hypothetical protein
MVEALWRPVESLGGKRAFEALLSRALAASDSDFPLLKHVELKPSGVLADIGTKEYVFPNALEAAEAELAVFRSLVGLLRTIVGRWRDSSTFARGLDQTRSGSHRRPDLEARRGLR